MTTKQEHYNWILRIIDSSLHTFHFECVDRMIEIFNSHHNDDDLLTCLKYTRNIHYNNVHTILS